MGAQGAEFHVNAVCQRLQNAAKAAVKKPWCLHRSGAYLKKSVADNQAGTCADPPTIPLLTDMAHCTRVWGGHGCRVAGQRAGPTCAH